MITYKKLYDTDIRKRKNEVKRNEIELPKKHSNQRFKWLYQIIFLLVGNKEQKYCQQFEDGKYCPSLSIS